MIEGVVNGAYEPVVLLTLQGPSGQASDIEATIDTGFTGFLTVPPALAAELGLALEGTSRATLADAADTTPLVGMRMLDRHNLNIDVEDGGLVVIQAQA